MNFQRRSPSEGKFLPSEVYEAPRVKRLTPEQAKLKLLGHLSVGEEGARDLLDLLFSDPGRKAPSRLN